MIDFLLNDTALLVIGYGNTLRQDDQAGPAVADIIGQYELPGVRTLSCAQLLPEHAALIARAGEVIFIDAQADITGPIRLQTVSAGEIAQGTAPAVEPPTLLARAREVYGRCPPAWLLTVHAEKFGIGSDLSSGTRKGILAAVYKVRDLSRRRPVVAAS
jgi:hydrogenase maturation protease